jgi:arabinogalactan endo-1,4-beta-galactosidase
MKLLTAIKIAILSISFASCNDAPELQKPLPPTDYDMSGFVRGADVSWLTEMEKSNVKFRNSLGVETECMGLLRDLGMNAIRLRVWVDPANGWCNKEDLLVKAWRANQLGFRLMIDFHYSDVWADPGSQTKPAAWADLSFDDLKTAVGSHTKEVLNLLKSNNIAPEWVQVGNETGNGMLWPDGKASDSMKNYAGLNNAGYDAVKEVFPDAKVIVHLQEGHKNALYRWLFDGLKGNGGKWDVIGMSLYPTDENWKALTADMIGNMNDMISRYGTPVMVCETGMPWDDEDTAFEFLTEMIKNCKSISENRCEGVLYWEPQSYNSWNGYTLGAFNASGMPTKALDAFKK